MKKQLWWLVPLGVIWLFGMWMTSLYLQTVDQALVVPVGSSVEGLDDLAPGDTLGVTTFTTAAFYAEENVPDGVAFAEFDDEASTVSALRVGDVDAIAGGAPTMVGVADGDEGLEVAEIIPTAAPAWAVVVILVGNVITFGISAFVGLRRPEARIGQLFALATAGFAVSPFLLSQIIEFLPEWAIRPIAVLGAVLTPAALAAVCWVIALFPTGRHPSPGWRWISWYLVAFVLVFTPLTVREYATADLASSQTFPEVLDDLGFYGALVALLAGLVSLVVRFRRGDRQTRAQLGWLLYAVAVYAVFLVLADAVFGLEEGLVAAAWDQIFYVPIPIAIAIAVLRYRLYEIDRIVSRTVSYGIVVAAMALVYIGVISLLQLVLPVEGDLAVAISTLAAVAVSVPLVRRVRDWVDRRFFRSRYDAGEVVARVADDLRTTVDLGEVTARAEAVVDEVFAPETMDVWLAGDR